VPTQKRLVSGVLLLDKPAGISSNHALQQVKRLYSATKAGHTGTLDVLASGLLPICLGEATKFAQYLLAADKRYRVVAKLGARTETCDAEGAIIEQKNTAHITSELLTKTLQAFTGQIEQTPSMYSALKHQGQPLYKLARKGIEVERKIRQVMIYDLKLLSWQNDLLVLDVHCSKGTYIRNLVDDMGQALGCGAYVLRLRRQRVGAFSTDQMMPLSALKYRAERQDISALDSLLLPVEKMVEYLPSLLLTAEQSQWLQTGRRFMVKAFSAGLVRCYSAHNQFLGIGEVQEDGLLIIRRLLRQDIA